MHEKTDDPPARPLLTESDFRVLLGGMCERKFKELRATGVIPAPLDLGPRFARWTHEDYLQVVKHLPRRPVATEPESLSQGRRARIERLKQGRS